jgi:hypothetical protein
MNHTQRERVALASSFLALAVVALAISCLGIALSGCGSFGRGHYDNAPMTYLHVPGVTFVTWPTAKRRGVTFRVIGGNGKTLPFGETPNEYAHLGAHAWDSALSGRLALREATSGEAEDITIHLVSNHDLQVIDDPAYLASPLTNLFDRFLPSLQGETFLTYAPGDPEQHILHADVYVADGLLGDRVREITAHEMGHAEVGVRGHPTTQGDLMDSIVPRTSTPSPRDIATVQALYPLLPPLPL